MNLYIKQARRGAGTLVAVYDADDKVAGRVRPDVAAFFVAKGIAMDVSERQDW